jgi:hypothetical protein
MRMSMCDVVLVVFSASGLLKKCTRASVSCSAPARPGEWERQRGVLRQEGALDA